MGRGEDMERPQESRINIRHLDGSAIDHNPMIAVFVSDLAIDLTSIIDRLRDQNWYFHLETIMRPP